MQDVGNIFSSTIFWMGTTVFLLILLPIQWIWLNSYFKKQRSIEQAKRGRYIKYFVGRGGTGFVGVHKHSLTIFIDAKTEIKIPYDNLYIYKTGNRFDFKEGPEPLTMHDRTYGVVLSIHDTKYFKKFIKERNLNYKKL